MQWCSIIAIPDFLRIQQLHLAMQLWQSSWPSVLSKSSLAWAELATLYQFRMAIAHCVTLFLFRLISCVCRWGVCNFCGSTSAAWAPCGPRQVIQPNLNSHSELVDSYGCRGRKGCQEQMYNLSRPRVSWTCACALFVWGSWCDTSKPCSRDSYRPCCS